MRISAIAIAVLATACAASGTASAAATAYADGGGNVAFNIPVYASISGSCGFGTGLAPSGSYALGEISGGFTQRVSFAVTCSGPTRIAVVSTNAGLRTAASAPTGYTNQMDYTVALALAGDTSTAAASCAASTLGSSGSCSFRGPSSGSRGLQLNDTAHDETSSLTVSAPAWSGANALVASTAYADTLTVTISPSS